ncbi:MAG: metalloregulator ArsR/SmtB family transcription factor [Pseudomonadota bacterium]|nr:metalloregulator ArsR/SmtB family transcription factor [Pseudomonadota bacterium]
MPSRTRVARELAEIFKLMAHPDRIRLIEELRSGEKDVNALADFLGLAASRVSQHLLPLRAHRLDAERRDGRHHHYQLVQLRMADWTVDGLAFLEGRGAAVPDQEIYDARKLWSTSTGADH